MTKGKSKSQLIQENKMLRQHGFYNNTTKIIRDLIKWGGLVIIILCATNSINNLAGKNTFADIGISAKGEFSSSHSQKAINTTINACENNLTTELLAIIFGVLGLIYGKSQARLRKNVIERYHPNHKKDELTIDPNRSSSGLTRRGETRPEDV